MQIHVARNSAQLGIFAPEEIIAGLQSGRFLASDLAWRDGMAAWTPLGDWSEFRGVGAPASPSVMPAAPTSVSVIPWEQGKSLGSFFATIKMAIANPSSLSTGRFAFGDWVVFCYVGVLISLPFQLINVIAFGDKNAQVGEFLLRLNIPEVTKLAEQLTHAAPAPVWATLFGAFIGLAIAPFLYAFVALFHWIGQRIFRYQVSVERTVAASLLVTATLAVLMAPLQLIGFSFPVQMALSALLLIPACVVYYRALGAATGISPWAQFGIDNLIWFVLCCCCCFLPAALFWGAAVNR
jgi:GYF domain 2